MIKTLFLSLALAACSLAATTFSLTGGPVKIGQTTLTLNVTGSTGVAYQWQLTAPANFTIVQTTATGKTLTCQAQNPTNTICVLYNPTAGTVIPDGPIATIQITGGGVGNISINNILGVSTTLQPVPVANVVLDARDLNGDGKVDVTDVGIAINEALGVCQHDLNGDNVCNVIDVMIVVFKVLGITQ